MDVRRVGMIAYHSSPLAEPGSGDAGGMTVYVRGAARALGELGISTDIFTRASGRGSVEELWPGVRVVPIDAGPRRPVAKETAVAHLADFVAGIRAFRTVTRAAYDVWHSHYWQSGLAGIHLASANVPLVHSSHTLSLVKSRFAPGSDEIAEEARVRTELQVTARADVLVASTKEEGDALARLYGVDPGRITRIAPGVDHDVFKPGDRVAARRAIGAGDEALLLYVGRVQPLKGIELAIAAAAEAANAVERGIVMLVVGGPSGPEGDAEFARLHALAASLGVADRVRFEGPQPHDRLPLYYRAADVLLFPSRSESFGLAALEAHACGTPVVSTAVGGARDVVLHGHSGFVIDERDPSLAAGYIKTVLAEPDSFRRQAFRQSRAFSWNATADALGTLYSCLLREQLPEVCTC